MQLNTLQMYGLQRSARFLEPVGSGTAWTKILSAYHEHGAVTCSLL